MKKILFLSLAVLAASVTMAHAPKVPANKAAKLGADVTVENAVPVGRMVQSLQALDGEKKMDVKIQGEVVQVCEAEGCWLRMKNGDGTIMVRMKDHKFFVPTLMKGKTIV